jgi:peptidoglycan hydrolase CwlO-like protein
MSELFGLQLETVEAIIVALGTSFVGTGTVALIVKSALGRVTRTMKAKVLEAEERNKISSAQAEQTMKALTASETILKAQVDSLREEIDKLIRSQNQTNRNVQSLLDEYKARDEQIKDLIVKEFGDDIE